MAARARAARLADLPRVAALDAESFGAHAYPAFFFRQALDLFGDLLRVVETDDGEVAGYALGGLAAGETDGWLVSMAVAPTHRGRGLAARLVEDLVEHLRERGARSVRLTVEPTNRPAAALYERQGFRVVGQEPDYFGAGEERLVMARPTG